MARFGGGRKWGRQPDPQPAVPEYVLGTGFEHGGRYWVRTTIRGYAFLWAIGYRSPAQWTRG